MQIILLLILCDIAAILIEVIYLNLFVSPAIEKQIEILIPKENNEWLYEDFNEPFTFIEIISRYSTLLIPIYNFILLILQFIDFKNIVSEAVEKIHEYYKFYQILNNEENKEKIDSYFKIAKGMNEGESKDDI